MRDRLYRAIPPGTPLPVEKKKRKLDEQEQKADVSIILAKDPLTLRIKTDNPALFQHFSHEYKLEENNVALVTLTPEQEKTMKSLFAKQPLRRKFTNEEMTEKFLNIVGPILYYTTALNWSEVTINDNQVTYRLRVVFQTMRDVQEKL